MQLPSNFAYDTETGRCPDGIRTVLVQICSTSARSPEEVRMLEGEDALGQFLDLFESTQYDTDVHAYNLKYEFSWLRPWIKLKGYSWTDGRKLKPGEWTVMEDSMSVYRVKLRNRAGYQMVLTDDMKRVGPVPMEQVAQQIRKEHPDWWPSEETKLKAEDEEGESLYNVWWTFPTEDPRRIRFIEYARLDAYSQAMIARWLKDKGYSDRLTNASNGLYMALDIRYRQKEDEEPWQFRYRFIKRYPVLDRLTQDIVERSLVGGFVYGETGTFKGTFVHIDYSSSYPYEYAFGDMFIGKVVRMKPESELFYLTAKPHYFRWMLVSFDFEIKEYGMPAINCKDARTWDENYNGVQNKKMRSGRITERLFTETYLDELHNHYTITNLVIHEVWFAGRKTGDFKKFIEHCYNMKQLPELKGTMSRDMWKRFMNAGIHGKTITRTHRREVIYPDNERKVIEVINDPSYCSLIGFTAMMNARERLLRDCRIVQEAGHHVYMCDTDSMVTEGTEAEIRAILGPDKFVTEDGGFMNLGKFEFETSKDGASEFELFKCWGLKRYLEVHDGQYRKSAFAGMKDSLQQQLMEWETDGTEYTWEQNVTRSDDWGKVIAPGEKHARAEDIWYHPPVPVPRIGDPRPFYKVVLEMYRRNYNGNR